MPIKLDTDCFADEIAIDFPAVSHLVARARDRFVSEHEGRHRDTLTADVAVSAAEARHGVTLPLEVPVWGVCERCSGRGGTWAELCSNCAGSGERLARHVVNVTIPRRASNGSRFHIRLTDEHRTIRVQVTIVVRTS